MKFIEIENNHKSVLYSKSKVNSLSFYNITFDYDKMVAVFNSRSNTLLVMSPREYRDFVTMSISDEKVLQSLIEKCFYVHDGNDEQIRCLNEQLNECGNQLRRMITILPTQVCNARCFYCFNNDLSPLKMNNDCVINTINYLLKHYDKTPYDIHWFGGEPLCATDIIDDITTELRFNGVDFSSRITTNGSYLNRELIRKIESQWKTRVIHMVCDGYGIEHNKRKRYINVENAYEQLLNNLSDLLLLTRDLKVILRINLDKGNYLQLKSILSDISKYLEYKNFYIQISYLRAENSLQYDSYFKTEAEIKSFYCYVFSVLTKMNISSNHILGIKPSLKKERCFAETKGDYVICSDGSFCKCLQSDYSGVNLVGDFSYQDESKEIFWVQTNLDKKCYDCKLLPLCRGGCKYRRLKQNGLNYGSSCDNVKYYLDAYVEYLISLDSNGIL